MCFVPLSTASARLVSACPIPFPDGLTPISQLEDATESSVNTSSDRHRRTEAAADRELERMRSLLTQIDRLEEDFKKVTRIKEVVKRLKLRVDEMDERVQRSSSSRHGDSRHGDRHGDRHSDSRHGDKSSSARHADLTHRPRHR